MLLLKNYPHSEQINCEHALSKKQLQDWRTKVVHKQLNGQNAYVYRD